MIVKIFSSKREGRESNENITKRPTTSIKKAHKLARPKGKIQPKKIFSRLNDAMEIDDDAAKRAEGIKVPS